MAGVLLVFAFLAVFLTADEGKADQQFLLHNGVKMEDTRTGLQWAIDAGTPSFGKCKGGKKTWYEAADYVSCLNSGAYLGYRDWRLPAAHELSGLISKIAKANKREHQYGLSGPKLRELGFKNIQPSLYWSSVSTGEIALAVEVLTNGRYHSVGKLNALYVWPMRGGRKGK